MNPSPSGALDIKFLEFFATPAFVATVPDAAAANETLKQVILDRERHHPSLDLSNVGGWHSSIDMAEWGGPALEQMLVVARQVADGRTCLRSGRRAQVDWRVECWANINRRGGANKRHTHPGCFWSGTYYVDDGISDDLAADIDADGEFVFHDPRGVAEGVALPDHYAVQETGAIGEPVLVRPRAGSMVLFPSWMPHAVRPYQGDGVRISIAFNLALPGGAT
jgi:uncharacterized protein (TIGR02466 family)